MVIPYTLLIFNEILLNFNETDIINELFYKLYTKFKNILNLFGIIM